MVFRNLALSAALLGAPALAQNGDNVLIVVADDLGVDQVGVYAEGVSPANTPTIDTIASSGVLFRNGWAYPTCSPARASLLTGRHGVRTGIGSPGRPSLPLGETTIPEALDAANSGYAHAWIGKWHVESDPNHPNDSGWSHFAGPLGGSVGDYFNWQRTVNGQTSTSTTYSTTQIANDAIGWIQAQTSPWVCVLAFNAPHTPYHVPPANLHTQTLPGTPQSDPIPHYQAAIEAMDTELARVLASLGTDLARTNVVFLGDNGTPRRVTLPASQRDHAKGSPYEGGVRVPFLLAGPAVTFPGREVNSVVSITDIFTTIGDLIAVDVEQPILKSDSISFAPYLSDPSQPSIRESIYAESYTNRTDPNTNGFSCARSLEFKLVRNYQNDGSFVEELYHLPTDPVEQVDRFAFGLSAVEQQARDQLAAHIESVRDRDGRFEPLGNPSCFGSSGPLAIGGSGTPATGRTYQVSLSNGPSSGVAVLTTGTSAETFNDLSLPYDLTAIGAGPGCLLLTSAEWTVSVATNSLGSATMSYAIPNDPSLVAASLFHSWIAFDAAAPSNPLGVVTAPGIRVRVGN